MKILAFTPTFANRGDLLERAVLDMRATAGMWFDWHIYAGNPTTSLKETCKKLVDSKKIQGAHFHPHNRGQHYAFADALALAREEEYDFILRLDDDIQGKTKRWLRKMVERLKKIKEEAGDSIYRFVASPYIKGLRNQLHPAGTMEKTAGFPVEIMDILGGACRLHPMDLFKDFTPDLYAPLGRNDPEHIVNFLNPAYSEPLGYLIRFPDIRVIHRTDENEERDNPLEAHYRRMGYAWPYIAPSRVDGGRDQKHSAP